jgi:hypothetical protein
MVTEEPHFAHHIFDGGTLRNTSYGKSWKLKKFIRSAMNSAYKFCLNSSSNQPSANHNTEVPALGDPKAELCPLVLIPVPGGARAQK